MMHAQGSLEYLIIIAAVLAVSAVVILTVTGIFSGQQSFASLSACKQAAVDCKASKILSPDDPCNQCSEACKDTVTKKEVFKEAVKCCKKGTPENIYADSEECICHSDGECGVGKVCLSGYCCSAGQMLCDDEGTCGTSGCSSVMECGALDPFTCMTNIKCENPGECGSKCTFDYAAADTPCNFGQVIPHSYCGPLNDLCTVITSYSCNSAHQCLPLDSTPMCGSCGSGKCCRVDASGTPSCTSSCGGSPPIGCGTLTCSSGQYCCTGAVGITHECCDYGESCCAGTGMSFGLRCCPSGTTCQHYWSGSPYCA